MSAKESAQQIFDVSLTRSVWYLWQKRRNRREICKDRSALFIL